MRTLLCSALLATGSALAQESAPIAPPPPADEIKRVLEYQENGKDRGPALLEVVACNKVDQTKGSPTAFTCLEPITGPVKKGAIVHVWSQWFCPKGGKYEDIRFQWLHEKEVRATTDITVEGLAKVRTWRAQTVGKAGKWTVKVFRGDVELGSTSLVVEN
jgi:hypothetical protein